MKKSKKEFNDIKCPTCKKLKYENEWHGIMCDCYNLGLTLKQPEWDEVVKDEVWILNTNEGMLINCYYNGLASLTHKYLGEGTKIPVRIKCAKGKILIERIDNG